MNPSAGWIEFVEGAKTSSLGVWNGYTFTHYIMGKNLYFFFSLAWEPMEGATSNEILIMGFIEEVMKATKRTRQ